MDWSFQKNSYIFSKQFISLVGWLWRAEMLQIVSKIYIGVYLTQDEAIYANLCV